MLVMSRSIQFDHAFEKKTNIPKLDIDSHNYEALGHDKQLI